MLTEEDKKWIAEQIAGVHLEMAAMGDLLTAKMDTVEQRIIKSFRDWQVSVTPRLQADAVLIGTFETRLEGLEQRMLDIELAARKQ